MIIVRTCAQFRVRITQLSLEESEKCISKQAYYDVDSSQVIVLSMDVKCDTLLISAFKNAVTTPADLKIQVVNNAKDYEDILRVVQDICYITVIQDSNKTHAIWFLFDCTKNGEIRHKKSGIIWLVIISLTMLGTVIGASIGICSYLAFRKYHLKKEPDDLNEKEIADENVDEPSKELNYAKPSRPVSYLKIHF
uniref:Uncharacterized protein n=1 Tax=Setaria digitata TaxID=48799 RepID=A0A915PSK6_9BILA